MVKINRIVSIIKKVELMCGRLTLSCSANSIQARQLLAVAIYINKLNETRARTKWRDLVIFERGTHHVLDEVRGHSSLRLKVTFVVVIHHGCMNRGREKSKG